MEGSSIGSKITDIGNPAVDMYIYIRASYQIAQLNFAGSRYSYSNIS